MKKNQDLIIFIFLLLMIAGIFIIDSFLPLGMAVGFAYVLILFISSRFNIQHTVILTVVSSAAILTDLIIGPGNITSFIIFNRLFAVLLIWLMSFLFIKLKKTELQLKDSELHYRNIVEATDEGILISDKSGQIKFANQKTSEFLGYSNDELKRSNLKNFIPEIEIHKIYEHELKLIRKDKSNIYIYMHSVPLNSGETDQLIVIRDITSRKKVEEALKESQARLSGIVSSAMDAIITVNRDQKIVLFNKAAESMFGYSQEDILGRDLGILIPKELREIHKQQVVSFGKTGVTNRHMGALGAVKGVKKDGTEFPIEASISQIETSGHKFYTVILRDITERKIAEQQLMESENRFRNMADNAPVLIWLSDENMRLIYFNKTWLNFTGRTIEQEQDMGWTEIIHPDDVESVVKSIRHSFIKKKPFVIEFRLLRKDGEYRWILNQSLPRFTSEKQFIGCIGSSVDITERKNFEEQLNASLKEKEVLLKEVHHRVKNNLQIISSLLNLQSEFIKDERMIELLVESQNRIKSMALIHEKLYQTKALAKIDLLEYITDLANNLLMSYLTDVNEVKLHLNIENEMLDIDSGIDIGLIVNELVSNSLKYAFPPDFEGEKSILISLKKLPDSDKIQLLVKDSGIGIPEDFDLGKSESLGLQLVETLTLQLDGTFEYKVNNGTEVYITF